MELNKACLLCHTHVPFVCWFRRDCFIVCPFASTIPRYRTRKSQGMQSAPYSRLRSTSAVLSKIRNEAGVDVSMWFGRYFAALAAVTALEWFLSRLSSRFDIALLLVFYFFPELLSQLINQRCLLVIHIYYTVTMNSIKCCYVFLLFCLLFYVHWLLLILFLHTGCFDCFTNDGVFCFRSTFSISTSSKFSCSIIVDYYWMRCVLFLFLFYSVQNQCLLLEDFYGILLLFG